MTDSQPSAAVADPQARSSRPVSPADLVNIVGDLRCGLAALLAVEHSDEILPDERAKSALMFVRVAMGAQLDTLEAGLLALSSPR